MSQFLFSRVWLAFKRKQKVVEGTANFMLNFLLNVDTNWPSFVFPIPGKYFTAEIGIWKEIKRFMLQLRVL